LDKKIVESCKTKDPNCLSCENITGFCLKCEKGELDKETGTCIIRKKLEGGPKAAMEAAKSTMAATTAVLMPLNTSGGIVVVKIIQIFDYLGFVDVEKPSNVDAVFQMFNSNFLSLIPNPFSNDDYNDDYDGKSDTVTLNTPHMRLIADST
jgi:hypothetical protein